jgi:hypothetical protein
MDSDRSKLRVRPFGKLLIERSRVCVDERVKAPHTSPERHHVGNRSPTRALAASIAALAFASGATASTAQGPTCVGAATLDPASGCVDRLTTVYPSVTGPRSEVPAPCRPLREARNASACVLGARRSRARLQFAFIGDSHTGAWSAPLGELGQELGWRGTVFTGPGCVMSEAAHEMNSIARGPCVSAYKDTMTWLRRHHEIDFVIVTAEVDKGLPGPVATIEPRKVAGFQRTFKRFPRNVRRVIVLRDTPNATPQTFACLDRVVREALAPAGPQCATPRRTALLVPDAAVAAATGLRSSRYSAVDMTDLMCSPTICYPALGGVLLNMDVGGHMTLAFARTMKRQLLHRIEPLLPAPRAK